MSGLVQLDQNKVHVTIFYTADPLGNNTAVGYRQSANFKLSVTYSVTDNVYQPFAFELRLVQHFRMKKLSSNIVHRPHYR